MQVESFRDFDAFVGSNPQLDARFVMNGKGPWRSMSESLFAADCWMMNRYANTGFLGEGIGSSGGYGFYIPDQGSLWTCNGVGLHDDKIAVFEPGAEFSGHCTAGANWHLFFIPRHLMEGNAGLGRLPNPYFYVVGHQQKLGNVVRNIFRRVFSAVAEHPSIETSPAMKMVEAELRGLLEALIEPGLDGTEPNARGGQDKIRLRHNEIMWRANKILADHEDRPIHVAELSGLIGVSERTLRRVFNEYYAVGPRSYLLLRQLNKVRHSLLVSDCEETTVTDVLTRWGVWELGRFAGRYRRQFGELPSMTLRRRPAMTLS